ncbi:hypothetical protein Ddc_13624 [Ditylenchus destructor]|nr:hypothetical protein Ddc_13624 [Ditylenchus destructor]
MRTLITISIVAMMILPAAGSKESAAEKAFKGKLESVNRHLAKASGILEKANSENSTGDNAPKNPIAVTLKEDGEKLKKLGQDLTQKVEQIPEKRRAEASKQLATLFSQFMGPLKEFIKTVQQKISESDDAGTASDSDLENHDSCPNGIEGVNIAIDEKVSKLEQLFDSAEREDKEETDTSPEPSRAKRSPKGRSRSKKRVSKHRHLKRRRYLSWTLGLPLHLTALALCVAGTLTTGVCGLFAITGWALIGVAIGHAMVWIAGIIEWLVLPDVDAKGFYVKYEEFHSGLYHFWTDPWR